MQIKFQVTAVSDIFEATENWSVIIVNSLPNGVIFRSYESTPWPEENIR